MVSLYFSRALNRCRSFSLTNLGCSFCSIVGMIFGQEMHGTSLTGFGLYIFFPSIICSRVVFSLQLVDSRSFVLFLPCLVLYSPTPSLLPEFC